MIDESDHYLTAFGDIAEAQAALRPPRRITVAEGAAQAMVIKQPGLPTEPWSAAETPYMVEPMNCLASRIHEAVAFAGPARSGKTMGFSDAWVAHVVDNDPGDMMIVQMSQDKAREFSKTRIDRMLENSPRLRALRSGLASDDNTHDKRFKHGMWLRIAWPTATNLSGSDYRYVSVPDYDRTPDDIQGEGSKFALARKRTTTFMSRGMTAAESSPGRPRLDPNWVPATAHEAPPVGTKAEGSGILGIYNQGDRRRWYWPCFDCRECFEATPGLGLFGLPSDDELLEMVREADLDALAKQYARIICPHCGSLITAKFKGELNTRGRWVPDGQMLTADGELVGTPFTSSIASFWLGGVAATYQPWHSLLQRFFQGLREYALNGSEQALQTTVNTDQAMPYMSRHLIEGRADNLAPADRADKNHQRFIVPDWARCIIVSVDVQGGSTARFIVQAFAVGPYREKYLLDRYEIRTSKRPGMGEEYAPIDPARYAEDWDLLTEKIVRATYRTTTPGRELRVKLTVVDTGGEHIAVKEGVSDKAYAWHRRLRREGLQTRVMLSKGNNTKTDWLIKETWVGRRNTREDGDVPLYLLNPNLLKDIVSTGLKRIEPGPGYYHFPVPKGPMNPNGWLAKSFFDELQAETRNESGTWMQIRKRNDGFDLCVMAEGGCLRLGLDKVNWADDSSLPGWLQPLDRNTEIITDDQRRELQTKVAPTVATRRIARSSYVG
jgi:phage terminase large subunit GpA-like protein